MASSIVPPGGQKKPAIITTALTPPGWLLDLRVVVERSVRAARPGMQP
jgi:hypothetical protein